MTELDHTEAERFEAKYIPEPNTGCFLWLAATFRNGYGAFRVNGKMLKAHRFAYEHFRGPIPSGTELDHLCRVRSCVNPDHLEPVTHRENVLRGDGLAAHNARRTHCIHGHLLDDSNTYLYPEGGRGCRVCRAVWRVEWWAARKAAYFHRAAIDAARTTTEEGK